MPLPLAPPTAGHRDRPALVHLSFLKCCAPYTGGSTSASNQFFPVDFGLRPSTLGSAPRKVPVNGFPRDFHFDTAGIPLCCGPPVCLPSWPFGTFTWHLRTYTSELAVDSLPPRPSDMLPGRLVNCRGWTFTSKKGSRCRLHDKAGSRKFHQVIPATAESVFQLK